ncbi:hypothetical protein [Paenibacillus sp. FSL E2-0178]|uniref:hypothetical protein n=1 Tax=Paenibacillus sp. FSL E2-0178 TaxID=2921361 RepID=UPI0031596EA7
MKLKKRIKFQINERAARMQRIILIYKQFLTEPMWFKILIITTLLAAVIFSSSSFPQNGYYQLTSKLAAAIFFTAYGVNFRSNTRVSAVFFVMAAVCIFLSWNIWTGQL